MGKAVWAALFFAVTITGCGEPSQQEGLGELTEADEQALAGENGLTSNGLTSNGLTSNGLTATALLSRGLVHVSGGAEGPVLKALRDPVKGPLNRTMFRYLVSCALRPDQSVSYTWTRTRGERVTETYRGALGLAPTWATGGLDRAGREWISACVAARTNELGVQVPLSLRARNVASLAVSDSERAQFIVPESAFFGDLFANPPHVYACTLERPRAFSTWRPTGRTCATAGCGPIEALGPCHVRGRSSWAQVCADQAANNDWVSDCRGDSEDSSRYQRVVTTWLRAQP